MFGPDYLGPRNRRPAEFATVLVFALTGAMLIAASADLLILFIALELMVLPGYLLAAYHKSDAYSTEGAIKYFLLGSFSSAIFLFGLAFVWGLTGHDQHGRGGGGAQRDRGRNFASFAGLAMGLALLTTGVAVQDRGRAIPLLDARRVPGLADAGHRLPVGRPEARRVRADPSPLRRRALPAGRVVAAGHPCAVDADDDARQPRRADPGQRQADAGVQLDRHTGYMLVGLAAYGAGEISRASRPPVLQRGRMPR